MRVIVKHSFARPARTGGGFPPAFHVVLIVIADFARLTGMHGH